MQREIELRHGMVQLSAQLKHDFPSLGHHANRQPQFRRFRPWFNPRQTPILRSERRKRGRLGQEEHAERAVLEPGKRLCPAKRGLDFALLPRKQFAWGYTSPLCALLGAVAALFPCPLEHGRRDHGWDRCSHRSSVQIMTGRASSVYQSCWPQRQHMVSLNVPNCD